MAAFTNNFKQSYATVKTNKMYEMKSKTTLSRLFCTAFNRIGERFEDVAFTLLVFSPSEEILALKNGDKINVEGRLRTASNPNIVQIRKEHLGSEDPHTMKSTFVEVIAFNDKINLMSKEDPTTNEVQKEPAETPTTEDNDGLPF